MSTITVDMLGKRFGKLMVISAQPSNNRGDRMWLCRCDCGVEKILKGRNLLIGDTTSCGCKARGPNPKDIVGEKYGRWTVISYSHRDDRHREKFYICQCECGNTGCVRRAHLVNGSSRSCGCLKAEHDNSREGDRNPNYNPELSPEERVGFRTILGYKEWCFLVKQRDGFRCVKCGEPPGGDLVSHHIFNYKDYPELRTDVNNGACLCEKCHREFHKIYGFRHTTKDQFDQFLGGI